jgi:CRP-like cAMP-binding protein
MAILSHQPRSTSCVAVGPTVLLTLDRAALAGLAAGSQALHDRVVFNLTALVCRRLGAVMGRVAETLEELRRTGDRRTSVQERFERSREGLAGLISDLLG